MPPQSWARRPPAPGPNFLLRPRRDGRDRRGEKVGRRGGGEGAGSSRERASEGKRRGGQPGPARSLPRPFLSHKRRQRAHQPCPALRPPRRRRAPRPRRPAPRRPLPAAAAGPLALLRGRAGRRGRGPWGVGGAEHRGVFRLGPPLSKKQKQKRGPRSRPPSPRPHLAGPECGELGCPVSCEACT